MIDLPVQQVGSWFDFSTELDSVTYGFEFRWNEREGCWYCTLKDGEGNALVSGRKVVLGPLFRKYRGVPGVMQLGDVYAIDTDSGAAAGESDPGLEDLGRRVVLTYATDLELGITG